MNLLCIINTYKIQVMIVEMILSRYYRLDKHDKKISHSSSAQQQSHELQQARVASQQ